MVDKLRSVMTAIAGLGVAATFLPWLERGDGAVRGTGADGWITLALFAAIAGLALLDDRAEPLRSVRLFGIELAALSATTVAAYDLSALHAAGPAAAGVGLYLALGAAIAAMVVATLGRTPIPILCAIIGLAGVAAAGIVHVPHGRHLPNMGLCLKSNWSLYETFPNVDDYIGERAATANPDIEDALIECGVIEKDRPRPTLVQQ